MSTEMGFDASTTDISNHLPGPHLTRSWHAFSCAAHHEPPLAAAAHSGLKPPPAGRSRRATQPPSLVQHRSQQTRHHSSDPIPRSCSQAPPPLQGHRRYYEPVRRRAPRRYSAPRRFSGLARSLSRPHRYSMPRDFCRQALSLSPPSRTPLTSSGQQAPLSEPAFLRSMQKPQNRLAPPLCRTPPGL